MNSSVTDHEAYEIDNREQYRELLIASRLPRPLRRLDVVHDTIDTLLTFAACCAVVIALAEWFFRW